MRAAGKPSQLRLRVRRTRERRMAAGRRLDRSPVDLCGGVCHRPSFFRTSFTSLSVSWFMRSSSSVSPPKSWFKCSWAASARALSSARTRRLSRVLVVESEFSSLSKCSKRVCAAQTSSLAWTISVAFSGCISAPNQPRRT